MVFLNNFHLSVKETYMEEIYKMTQNVVKVVGINAILASEGKFASSNTICSAEDKKQMLKKKKRLNNLLYC